MEQLKKKSDRKTLFLSFLDGNAEELHMFHDQLKQAGILDEYRVIVTAKPIQVLDEVEVADVAKAWAGNETGMSSNRMANVRHSIHYIEETLKQLTRHVSTNDENFKQIEDSFSNLQTSLINSLASIKGSGTPNAYFNRLNDFALPEIKKQMQGLERYSPKEGAEW